MGLGPGSRIRVQGSKRHRIPDPDPQHCLASMNGEYKAGEPGETLHQLAAARNGLSIFCKCFTSASDVLGSNKCKASTDKSERFEITLFARNLPYTSESLPHLAATISLYSFELGLALSSVLWPSESRLNGLLLLYDLDG